MKVCNHCCIELPLDAFNKNVRRNDGHQRTCRDCEKAYYRSYTSHKIVERTYGVTQAEYSDLLLCQDGRCAICGRTAEDAACRGNRLAIDHDHVTGAVRGLLCTMCNALLGMARDDTAVLGAAIDYLTVATLDRSVVQV